MGHYLDIARETKSLAGLPECSPTPKGENWPYFPLPAAPETISQADVFDRPASDVLDILVKAKRPVPHSEIMKALSARGYDKVVTYQAIARCQKRRWIEHDLLLGYVLTSD